MILYNNLLFAVWNKVEYLSFFEIYCYNVNTQTINSTSCCFALNFYLFCSHLLFYIYLSYESPSFGGGKQLYFFICLFRSKLSFFMSSVYFHRRYSQLLLLPITQHNLLKICCSSITKSFMFLRLSIWCTPLQIN